MKMPFRIRSYYKTTPWKIIRLMIYHFLQIIDGIIEFSCLTIIHSDLSLNFLSSTNDYWGKFTYRYTCDICGKEYKSKNHTTVTDNLCSICSKPNLDDINNNPNWMDIETEIVCKECCTCKKETK